MKNIPFRCSKWGFPLTGPLEQLQDPSLLVEADEQPHLPAGFYITEDGGYYTQRAGQYLPGE
jgi:hypothetical protein